MITNTIFWGFLLSDKYIVNPRKLEHGFRMMNAGIPYTENDVPTLWLLLENKEPQTLF